MDITGIEQGIRVSRGEDAAWTSALAAGASATADVAVPFMDLVWESRVATPVGPALPVTAGGE